jgi:hypothetical protein
MTTKEQVEHFYQFATAQFERQGADGMSFMDLVDEFQDAIKEDKLVDLLNQRWLAVQRGEWQDAREAIQKINAKHGVSIEE